MAESGGRFALRRFLSLSRPAPPRTRPALATGVISDRALPAPPRSWTARLGRFLSRRGALILLIGLGTALVAFVEVRTSALQALVLSRVAAALTYRVEDGPSPSDRKSVV